MPQQATHRSLRVLLAIVNDLRPLTIAKSTQSQERLFQNVYKNALFDFKASWRINRSPSR